MASLPCARHDVYRTVKKAGIALVTGQEKVTEYLHPKKAMKDENRLKKVMTYIGVLFSYFIPWKNSSGLFFFFPFYHVGGAEKVHTAIVSCFSEARPWVFFTGKSEDSSFKASFAENARLFDIWPLMPVYPFLVGFMAGYINRHDKAVIFGCNCPLFYSIIPFLRSTTRRVDLLHAFGGGIELLSLDVVPQIDARIVISEKTISDYKSLYTDHGVDSAYAERIALIENRLDLPMHYPAKNTARPLRILYIGRGTEEKRVHLIGKIATICHRNGIPAEFILVGDVCGAVEEGDRKHCRFVGKITDDRIIKGIYEKADLLLITSSREGMPMVVMEAMGHGVVPVCTDVGGISYHVSNGVNGTLVANGSDEEIVASFAEEIAMFSHDRDLLSRLSHAAFEYAQNHFENRDFCVKYRAIIQGSWKVAS